MTSDPRRRPATIDDLLARPEDERLELIRGTLVEKAAPTAEHSAAQIGTSTTLNAIFRGRGGDGSGGWWLFTELDVQLGEELFRPDVCGYRRDRILERPRGRPVRIAPDWVCEIISASKASPDRVEKRESYLHAGVGHHWLVDPVEGTLEVFRRTELGYTLVLAAHRGQRVRAEPFETSEVAVDDLLGDDPAEDP